MKKIFILMVTAFFAALSITTPASATDKPGADNKKVTICHYKANPGAEGGMQPRIEVSVNGWYSGHKDHSRDVWAAFSYTTKKGDVVNVPAQGDQALLAFADCKVPPVDEEIPTPAVNSVDKCGTTEDTVTPVKDDTKYSTLVGDRVGDSITVTFTAKDGFTFKDGKTVTVKVDFPNNDDCGLPDTGSAAVYNTPVGLLALGALALAGISLFVPRFRKN